MFNNYDCRNKGIELSSVNKGSDHYKVTDKGPEVLDIAITNGTFMAFCLTSIMKYANRWHRTKNPKDLMKIADYAHLALGYDALTNTTPEGELNIIGGSKDVSK